MAVVCKMCGQNALFKCSDCDVPLCSKKCLTLKQECVIGDGLMYDARLEVYKYLDPPEILNLEQTNKGLDEDNKWFDDDIWDYHLYTHYPSIYSYVKDRATLQTKETKRNLSINLYRLTKKSADLYFERRFTGNPAQILQRIADLVFAQYPDGDAANLNYRVFIGAKIVRCLELATLLNEPYGNRFDWTPMVENKLRQYLQNDLNVAALIEEYTAIQLERNPILVRNQQNRFTDWVRQNMKMIVRSAIEHIFAIDDRTLLISNTRSPFQEHATLRSLQYQVALIALGSGPDYLEFLHRRYLVGDQLVDELSKPMVQIDVDKVMRTFVMLDAKTLFTESFAIFLSTYTEIISLLLLIPMPGVREQGLDQFVSFLYQHFDSLRPVGNPDMTDMLHLDRDESGKIILGRIDYKQ